MNKKAYNTIVGKKYVIQDNSYNRNISYFLGTDNIPSITCACPASNEIADVVTIVTEPFKMNPTWIIDRKEALDMVIVEKDGQLYSTMYYPQGIVK